LRLWVESAYQIIAGALDKPFGNVVGTLTTEDAFAAILATRAAPEYLIPNTQYPVPNARNIGAHCPQSPFDDALASLARGTSPEAVAETLLTSLPPGEHVPFTLLQVGPSSVAGRRSAALVECDAPPLFMARRGRLVLLPVIEEESHGRLIRRCEFDLRDGDHLALVSEGYIQASGWDRRFGWRDIAISIRRLTETRCDAEQLAGALVRSYQRFAAGGVDGETRKQGNKETDAQGAMPGNSGRAVPNPAARDASSPQSPISVLAMFVRPMRTATVWSGPPGPLAAKGRSSSFPPAAAGGIEGGLLAQLMVEEDMRIICGDTTAEIAARLLGAELVMEPRPDEGWGEVPPVSRMVGADGRELMALVTEGVVTMRVARERLTYAKRPQDLTGRSDGASRLARLLLTADKVRFLVGLAVNPAQVERDGTPLRKAVVAGLAEELKERGKIVTVEYM
jgi:hypothetical protein